MPTLKLPKNTLSVYFMSGFITTCRIINLHFAIKFQNANLNNNLVVLLPLFLIHPLISQFQHRIHIIKFWAKCGCAYTDM